MIPENLDPKSFRPLAWVAQDAHTSPDFQCRHLGGLWAWVHLVKVWFRRIAATGLVTAEVEPWEGKSHSEKQRSLNPWCSRLQQKQLSCVPYHFSALYPTQKIGLSRISAADDPEQHMRNYHSQAFSHEGRNRPSTRLLHRLNPTRVTSMRARTHMHKKTCRLFVSLITTSKTPIKKLLHLNQKVRATEIHQIVRKGSGATWTARGANARPQGWRMVKWGILSIQSRLQLLHRLPRRHPSPLKTAVPIVTSLSLSNSSVFQAENSINQMLGITIW
jgi:hypothetical protein